MKPVSALRTRTLGGGTPKPAHWGVTSETGVLRDVLVGPSSHFQLLPTSAISKRTLVEGVKFDAIRARQQHGEFLDAFRSAGVAVHALAPDENLPYQIYARDSSVMTPFGAIISSMSQPWRRGEYAPAIEFYAAAGIPIYEIVTSGSFEGGDFCFMKPDAVVIGYSGERTTELAAQKIAEWLGAEGIEVRLQYTDAHFVHLDVIFTMLTESLAAVCVDVADPSFLAWLRHHRIEVLPVSYQDALKMGANLMALGEDRVLLSHHAKEVKAACRAHGLTVFDPDISAITQCGGGAHCLCQPLRRD